MKVILVTFLFLLNDAFAIAFKIENVCSDDLHTDIDVSVFLPATVSEITHYSFHIFDIPYEGTPDSIQSLIGTPTGSSLVEYLDVDHYFVYGWCYEVDGKQPDVLMSEYFVDPHLNLEIRWLFGYAEFLKGKWLSYCTPLNKNPREHICKTD